MNCNMHGTKCLVLISSTHVCTHPSCSYFQHWHHDCAHGDPQIFQCPNKLSEIQGVVALLNYHCPGKYLWYALLLRVFVSQIC